MIARTIVIAILIYFLVRTVLNLIRAIRQDGKPPAPLNGREGAVRSHPNASPDGVLRHRRRPGLEVEDAKWVDLK
jgi:hypothetical protein